MTRARTDLELAGLSNYNERGYGGLSGDTCLHPNGEIKVTQGSKGYTVEVFGSKGKVVYTPRDAKTGYPVPFSTYDAAYQDGKKWAKSKGYPDPPTSWVGCPLAPAPAPAPTMIVTADSVFPAGPNVLDDLIASIKRLFGVQ